MRGISSMKTKENGNGRKGYEKVQKNHYKNGRRDKRRGSIRKDI